MGSGVSCCITLHYIVCVCIWRETGDRRADEDLIPLIRIEIVPNGIYTWVVSPAERKCTHS